MNAMDKSINVLARHFSHGSKRLMAVLISYTWYHSMKLSTSPSTIPLFVLSFSLFCMIISIGLSQIFMFKPNVLEIVWIVLLVSIMRSKIEQYHRAIYHRLITVITSSIY